MSTSSAPSLFGQSLSHSDKPASSTPQSTARAQLAGHTDPNSSHPKNTSDSYLQDKDLNWWLTFARTFKSAVKTPLPDDDSDL